MANTKTDKKKEKLSKNEKYTIKRIMRTNSTRDAIFLSTALFLILPVGLVFIFISYNIYRERKEFVAKYPLFEYTPDIKDFGLGILSCIIIYLIRVNSIKYIFTSRAEKTVIEFPSKELRQKKIEKAAFARFRSLWYLAITIIGYYCLKDVEYLPRTLGGKARFEDLNLFWDGLPYQPQDRKVVVYYMIQFGSALCTFILQFKQNRTRNSYGEFLLHDMATLMLLVISFLNNYLRMGAVVLFLHDISDIFSYGCKIFVDTVYLKTTLFFYVSLVLSWFWTRLYVFPFQVILQCFTNNIWARPELVGYMIIAICLVTLLCLHVYWIVLILGIGVKFLRTGEADDMQDAEKSEDFTKSKLSDKRTVNLDAEFSSSNDTLPEKINKQD
ncbi:LAG1-domain-containing protein [Neocallimastix lanati (nom. inval.)]|jgi:ceramide synthetase|uniref:LAG1-domain-containing protein n=1 Tax=Neocallimastix californiae TaxID=1754190 RepID=A0A1Y2EMI9_9FUNG|nr:LAG1-domain-containing protein [Neocallimastix sp. JGI-2020a]ORY72791.1 LAG1-domain-containing protein [Neocallimastix californiae]|eukprot:ORY72791.1 LAG1-domain-containing protein [Neocallimastix californiae]